MEETILLLASSSPRRRQLLTLAGQVFEPHPVNIDETPRQGEAPDVYVLRLAQSKAHAAGVEAPDTPLILAADTTVADGSLILGKPQNELEAVEMLHLLRGRSHQVYTALALYQPSQNQLMAKVCSTRVTMRDYSEEEIRQYIASGDPMDKAGAYAIQHAGFHPVENIEGCYTNVIGLPLCLLQSMLSEVGFNGAANLAVCPADANLCPVCNSLMRGENAV
jgi:MAF protein